MNSHLPIAYELRVLSGEHQGTVIPMEPGVPLTVGTDWDNEVVLPLAEHSGAGAIRLALTLEPTPEGAGLCVEVLQGEVCSAAGKRQAGSVVHQPLYQPLGFGGIEIASGESGSARWPVSCGAPIPLSSAGAVQALHATRTSWIRRGAAAVLALVAASLGMLALASAVSPQRPAPERQARQTQALLHARGFAGLSVQAGEADMVVSGHLETLAQRSQVERILQAEGVRARLQVGINEQVVAAVREVYRLHGLAAEVHAVGPGVVSVRTGHPDAAAVARIQAVVQRDVAGLRELQADNQVPPRHPSPVPAVDDPGKRVAAIVPGETAHVVTVDGTRYFEGALLPTGHRIVAIENGTVQLEREGQASALQF